ncbi:ATP-binding protein [Variovorax robiniae]|uniref:ATP-binding protein n=1 Tax=Variovorax robiniae TaxID=1836199 RepID=A0ABU8XIC9_9BURK
MEVAVITGWTHKAFPMDDASCVGEARRHAANAAADMGWGEVDAGRLALVVTELGTNLQRHAKHGRLLIAVRAQACAVEVISIDEGPGIPDIALALQDGHSSGSTPGTGLGAVRRLASEFDMHSAVPDGTVSVARVRPSAAGFAHGSAMALQIGAICLPAPYETVCGDAWAVAIHGGQTSVLVADGLGHGPDAAKASQAALGAFASAPEADVCDTVQRVHRELRTTRGAAVLALRVAMDNNTVTYSGAGNIAGRVLSGVFDKSLITQHGTAGVQIRKPQATSLELPAHALVILHSDGIATRWTVEHVRPLLQKDPTLLAAVLLRDHTRHRDDATVVVIRPRE